MKLHLPLAICSLIMLLSCKKENNTKLQPGGTKNDLDSILAERTWVKCVDTIITGIRIREFGDTFVAIGRGTYDIGDNFAHPYMWIEVGTPVKDGRITVGFKPGHEYLVEIKGTGRSYRIKDISFGNDSLFILPLPSGMLAINSITFTVNDSVYHNGPVISTRNDYFIDVAY